MHTPMHISDTIPDVLKKSLQEYKYHKQELPFDFNNLILGRGLVKHFLTCV